MPRRARRAPRRARRKSVDGAWTPRRRLENNVLESVKSHCCKDINSTQKIKNLKNLSHAQTSVGKHLTHSSKPVHQNFLIVRSTQ